MFCMTLSLGLLRCECSGSRVLDTPFDIFLSFGSVVLDCDVWLSINTIAK